ncbi:hypothetical protein EDD21DRAFT_385555 [Dissophora ornata]|nr:hypothetical protein EDD21DRAFT_385555 [Dissophora ornata]
MFVWFVYTTDIHFVYFTFFYTLCDPEIPTICDNNIYWTLSFCLSCLCADPSVAFFFLPVYWYLLTHMSLATWSF